MCSLCVVSVIHVLCVVVLCVLYIVQFVRLEFAADLGVVSSIVFVLIWALSAAFGTGSVLWCC